MRMLDTLVVDIRTWVARRSRSRSFPILDGGPFCFRIFDTRVQFGVADDFLGDPSVQPRAVRLQIVTSFWQA